MRFVGELVDTAWHKKVLQKIDSLGLDHVVEIVGPVENVNEELEVSDIGVLSSESEGLPIALLEYGLAALPVVCTQVGNCTEVISTASLGWAVPAKNAEALATAIEEVLSDYPLAMAKGKNLQNKVKEHYGANQFLVPYQTLINSIH
jgi:glycosyltransferase involved in cell wall biosynthesis